MTVPLYSYDLSFRGLVPERWILKLERDGLAKVVRHKKGHIARAVLYKRPGEPEPPTVRDYMGKGYSFKHHLEDGHRPWALKPLSGRAHRGDENIEFHLAPDSVRPIFLRVLLDCLVPARVATAHVS
jgi:hypothetical protein